MNRVYKVLVPAVVVYAHDEYLEAVELDRPDGTEHLVGW
jgi:hypothetical protein